MAHGISPATRAAPERDLAHSGDMLLIFGQFVWRLVGEGPAHVPEGAEGVALMVARRGGRR